MQKEKWVISLVMVFNSESQSEVSRRIAAEKLLRFEDFLGVCWRFNCIYGGKLMILSDHAFWAFLSPFLKPFQRLKFCLKGRIRPSIYDSSNCSWEEKCLSMSWRLIVKGSDFMQRSFSVTISESWNIFAESVIHFGDTIYVIARVIMLFWVFVIEPSFFLQILCAISNDLIG